MDWQQLIHFDQQLLLKLNGSDSLFWDGFMMTVTRTGTWIPLAVVLFYVLIKNNNMRNILFILLMIALTITIADQFASTFCKPYFKRFRPTNDPILMYQVDVVNNYRGGLYGFISSHAANAFGFAMFMTLLLRNKLLGITLFIWATINAYTRIYLGVHFISDIVPGMLSGLLFGFVAYHIYMWARYHFLSASVCPFLSDPSYMYQGKRVQAITIAVWLMFVFLLCFSGVLISFIR